MSYQDYHNFSGLPPAVATTLNEADFIRAREFDDNDRLVVWIADRQANRQRELEFSLKRSRLLTIAEREQAFPAEREVQIAELNLRVRISYNLEAGSDVLYECYEVSTPDGSGPVVRCEQICYLPMRPIKEVVREA